MHLIKQELELKEAAKEAAQKKKDKLDEAKAKAKVKQQIEEDKQRRLEKAAAEKAYVCLLALSYVLLSGSWILAPVVKRTLLISLLVLSIARSESERVSLRPELPWRPHLQRCQNRLLRPVRRASTLKVDFNYDCRIMLNP